MTTVTMFCPIPEQGAQVLSYRVNLVISEALPIDLRLKLGARIAKLIEYAVFDGVFIDNILPREDATWDEAATCQIQVELVSAAGAVPPFLPGGADHET